MRDHANDNDSINNSVNDNEREVPRQKVSNELPMEFNAEPILGEQRTQSTPVSWVQGKQWKLGVALALVLLVLVGVVKLFEAPTDKRLNVSKSEASKLDAASLDTTNLDASKAVAPQAITSESAGMIDAARAHLTESSIKKLIAENTRPSDNTQADTRLSAVEVVLAKLQEGQAKQLEMLGELKTVSDALKNQVASHESAIEAMGRKLDSSAQPKTRPVVIQRDAASFTPANTTPRARKTRETVKKPEPVVIEFPPVHLVSIKNFNGKSGATLTLNGEQSGLVLVGQSWRGFMLITADSSARSATIGRDGIVKNLSL
jgi:hypothetical protein